jgi:hypothetical protein
MRRIFCIAYYGIILNIIGILSSRPNYLLDKHCLGMFENKLARKIQCTTSGFGDELRRMLKIVRFRKHCSCHLQDEYVMVGLSLKFYTGQTINGELDLNSSRENLRTRMAR